ncbi:hypothetical protein [Hymenobacter sp. GOD-10R]|uniref:hypothetical protein n=1 Tax=Hymenobacter sp. GOD-10R TaxID=3093922 RepID=UPI002D7727D8|nr:hypothetical protein [Hymenobacter sp. GOD-10R]WRQ31661.1 hypothetical protein SD425_27905 [Hymenobacter sp. GOD-10R]
MSLPFLTPLTLCFASLLGLGSSRPTSSPTDRFEAINVLTTREKLAGKVVQKVTKSPTVTAFDEATFARLIGSSFHNGTIEVKVLSRLLPGAPALARGFIGLAFRINAANSQFENVYIRPVNGRAANQLQRNHSVQYFSYPDYRFERLRQEAPGAYESYADMGLNEWIRLRLVVHEAQAQLFLNDNKQPTLLVNDLKHGPAANGGIGLWVDVGTEGFFSDLKITPTP